MTAKHKATVLIVDDDQGHRTILLALINGWGYKAAGADDGTKAVTLAREKPFDLILMDVRMAGISGIEVMESGGILLSMVVIDHDGRTSLAARCPPGWYWAKWWRCTLTKRF